MRNYMYIFVVNTNIGLYITLNWYIYNRHIMLDNIQT